MVTKMVVFDLDGTLLRSDKTVSPRTLDALQRCQANGIKTVYATGRGGSAEHLVPQELFDGRITLNGALTKIGSDIVQRRLIPWAVARPFLLACHARGLKMASEAGGKHHTNFTVPDDWADTVHNWALIDFATLEQDAEKLYTFDLSPQDVDFIAGVLPRDLYMVMAVDGLLMIMHKDATKSNAVAKLADAWNINHAHIAAFGDDLNDIDLLQYAGTGVAMGNAADNVKAIARYVCDTNDNDGVARWLEDNVL